MLRHWLKSEDRQSNAAQKVDRVLDCTEMPNRVYGAGYNSIRCLLYQATELNLPGADMHGVSRELPNAAKG
jgi:hypothetical protein